MMDDDEGNFAKLSLEPQQLGKIKRIFEAHLRRSFAVHKVLILTKAEISRRFYIMHKAFKVCRGDLKFSIDRAAEEAGVALDKNLRGESWEPSKRATYSPNKKVEVRSVREGADKIQTEMKETSHGA